MGTVIRPELSVKNPYRLEKHRYYELKHFCLQYPLWKRECAMIFGFSQCTGEYSSFSVTNRISDPTLRCVEARDFFSTRIEMIEAAAKETDNTLSDYILTAVTEGTSFDCMRARYNIPCCKDTYYLLYHRFFWILDKTRK